MRERIATARLAPIGLLAALALLILLMGCARPSAAPAPAATAAGGAQSGAVAAPKAEPIVIKISHDVAVTQAKGIAFEKFKELAEKKLGDRVKVEHYHSAQLYPSDPKNVEALQAGAIQMVSPTFEKWTPSMPRFVLFTLPYVFANSDMMKEALDSPEIGGKLWPDLEAKGLKYLAVWSNGYRNIHTAKKQVKMPEDLKGLKIRVQAKDVFEPMFRLAGANAQVLAWSEVPQALQQGIVDGAETPYNAFRGASLWDVEKYIVENQHVYSGYLVATNKAFWDGLPDDVAKGLEDVMDEVTAWQWDANQQEEKDAKQDAIEHGTVITELSDAEMTKWAEFFRPVHKEYESVVGQDPLNALYELEKKYRK